ncbi:MAG: hypothetical protein ACJAQ6_002371 [Arenicella sp.]|jgi:hypothetical protein
MTKLVFWVLGVISVLMPLHNTAAVEALSAQELALHCKVLPELSDSIDGQYCIRYIQGFIDGAVATDVRVMVNVEAESDRQETIAERAIRTRLSSRFNNQRAASYAEFCLGDPVPLKDVVANVVRDLEQDLKTDNSEHPARDVVYQSLRNNYPCKDT